jgi:hypothetical protein
LGFSSVVLPERRSTFSLISANLQAHGNVKTEELFYKITSYQIKYL